MSRRDTIIIALLVNASLLALLFMLAVNTDDDGVSEQPEMVKAISSKPEPIPMPTPSFPIVIADSHVNDEVDNFLKDLAAEEKRQPLTVDEEGYVKLQEEPPVPVAKTGRSQGQQDTFDGEYVEVTVKRGDALEKIARANGTTVEAIKKANNMTTVKLSVGQVLKIPVSRKGLQETAVAPMPKQTQSAVPSKEVEKKIASADVQYYTVKSGDNPWKISKQFNVPFDELLKLNNLDEERARNMKVGDKIRVK